MLPLAQRRIDLGTRETVVDRCTCYLLPSPLPNGAISY
jgi:hypothetical protein